jgi:CheY-specific phosphatase CheX
VSKRLNRIFTKVKTQERLPRATTGAKSDKLATLIITDQDANFRHFFVTTLSTKFRVFEAINGAEAFMKVLQYQPDALFVGADLGVFSREELVRKIRSVENLRRLEIHAIVQKDAREPLPAASLYNGEIPRSFVPDVLLKCLDGMFPSAQITAEGVARFQTLLQISLGSATEEVFGMMMSTDVTRVTAPRNLDPSTPMIYALIPLVSRAEKLHATVTVKCERACAVKMAAHMLKIEASEADDPEMIVATLSEVVNVIGGRVKAALGEKIVDFTLGLPVVQEQPQRELSTPPTSAFSKHFAAGEDLRFSVSLLSEALPQAGLSKEPEPAEAASGDPGE